MLKGIVFLFGCITLVGGVASQDRAKADDIIRIFNVDVYVDRQPQCVLGPAISINASVSPFKAQVDLGDLITELARKGAETGSKIIYAIKLVSFIPYQGAKATAMASACMDADFLPSSYSSLLGTISQATSVRGFSFDDKVPGGLRSVSTSKLSPQQLKDENSIGKLRALILSRATYDLPLSIRKSCPFFPSFGFEMTDKVKTVWWLVSELCQTAELVSPDNDWRRTDVVNLSSGAISQFRALFASGDLK